MGAQRPREAEHPSKLLLLRHAEIATHLGDVPLTELGRAHAVRTGQALAATYDEPLTVLHGGTRRTRETAEALVEGIDQPGRVTGPQDSFALRNPDMYVALARVNLVRSAAALADQVPGMTEEQAAAHPWFAQFFTAPDRIGWWLEQRDVPGESGDLVAARIRSFAGSIKDAGPSRHRFVIGVTHSPVLRCLMRSASGADPGEPDYLTGVLLQVTAAGVLSVGECNPVQPGCC
jgi:broad specificity phosphatase PhoE